MCPPLQEPFLDDVIRNMGSHLVNQNMSAYRDGSLSHGSKPFETPSYDGNPPFYFFPDGSLSDGSEPFETFSYDANPTFHEEKGTITPSYGDPAMPTDIPSTALVDPSFTPPTMALGHIPGYGDPAMPTDIPSTALMDPSFAPPTMALGHIPGFPPLSSSPVSSSYSPSAVGPGHYYSSALDHKSTNYHSSGFPSSNLATPLGLDTRASTSKINVGQGQHRITCSVRNCGQSFTGKWEKERHFNSVHKLPTIGCRDCNYKHSRVDQFREHCRSRHPGKSDKELMVQIHDNGTCS